MTDHIIHSTQYYIKYIKRATLANLQHRPLKHGRLIVPQETQLWLYKKKISLHGSSLFSSPHPLGFSMLVVVSSKKCWTKPQCGAKIFISKYQNGMQKMARKTFNNGGSGTQYVVMVANLIRWYWTGHLEQSYCKESNSCVQIGRDICFHHIWSEFGRVYDIITWLICISYKLQYLWNVTRDIGHKNSKIISILN